MAGAAAASTLLEGAHAATQALAVDPGKEAATAVDALVASVLAVAARHPAVLLGSITILLGGTGEGLLALDGRARQPGLGAPRPRGFLDTADVPAAARIAAPGLPAALALAHAGRGTRALLELSQVALSSAAATGPIDGDRAASIRAFGRDGASFLRTGAIRDALLASAARSLGGLLTATDLDRLRPTMARAETLELAARHWAFAPWAHRLRNALAGGAADATVAEDALGDGGDQAVIATADIHGAVAIATISLSRASAPLAGTGLEAPLVSHPVMRGVQREAAGTPLRSSAALGIAWPKAGSVDLVLGVGGEGDAEEVFGSIVRACSAEGARPDECIARPRARRLVDEHGNSIARLEESPSAAFGIACGILIDSRGRARPLADGRR